MWKEFKEFALRGSMLDMAVGIIIGAAFSGLVQSLVGDIIMPVVGLFAGGFDFSQLFVQLSGEPADSLEAARAAGATIAYGNFISLAVNFLIVAGVLFLLVRVINRLRRRGEAAAAETHAPSPELLVLEEIRDILRQTR